MNRDGCLERWGGARRGGDRSPPSQEAGGRGKTLARDLRLRPFPRRLPPPSAVASPHQRWPRPRAAVGFLRFGTAGEEQSLCPGGQNTVIRAEDHPWQQTLASPPGVHTPAPASSARPHSLRRAQLPRPWLLPAGRRIRLPGWTERVVGGVFKAGSPPLPPPRSPPPVLLQTSPERAAARSRCRRSPRMPLPGPRW